MQTFGSIGFFVPWPSTIKVGSFPTFIYEWFFTPTLILSLCNLRCSLLRLKKRKLILVEETNSWIDQQCPFITTALLSGLGLKITDPKG